MRFWLAVITGNIALCRRSPDNLIEAHLHEAGIRDCGHNHPFLRVPIPSSAAAFPGSKAAFTRRGSISPPRDPSRVPRSFDRAPPHAHKPRARSLYTAKASRKPTAKPLTAPAPGQ